MSLGVSTDGPASFHGTLPTQDVLEPVFLDELSITEHSTERLYNGNNANDDDQEYHAF